MLDNYICALDLGSSKIASVVCQIKRKRLTNIFFESVPSKGIKRGVIIDSIGLVDTLGKALKNLKVKSGINIKSVYVNVSGEDIVTKHSRAVIPLAERGNKVITLSDIRRVNEQARILGSSLEEEIIHQIPLGYTIDSMDAILNPLGLYSHRLGIDLYLVCVRSASIQALSRVINQAGYEIKKIYFSGLATSKIVFNKELIAGINIFCDIGSDITELLIFKDGLLRDIEILPLGGDDLTMCLSDRLKIPFELAEDVKKSYGIIGDFDQIKEDKQVLVKKSDIYKPIQQKLVCQILTSKARFICQRIKDTVDKKLDSSLINNFVTVGRTTLLEGFLEMLENTLVTSVKPGRIIDPDIISLANIDNALSGQKYLDYITSLGIICEVFKGSHAQILPTSQFSRNPILKVINRFKEVYQEYF